MDGDEKHERCHWRVKWADDEFYKWIFISCFFVKIFLKKFNSFYTNKFDGIIKINAQQLYMDPINSYYDMGVYVFQCFW